MKSKTLIIEALSFKEGKAFGYQEYLFNILDYFFENKDDILYEKVIVICNQSEVNSFDKFSKGFEIRGFNMNNPFKKYWVLNTFANKMKLLKDDLILFTNNYSSLIKKCKHILVIHDLLYLRKDYQPNRFFRVQRHLFIPRSIKLADRIITISNFVKQDVLNAFKFVKEEKVSKVYNYFNFDKYKISNISSDIKEIKDNPYFLVVSSNIYHKNTITIFKAFHEFCATDSITKLVVVGGVQNNLKNYYNSLPKSVQERIIVLRRISNPELGFLYSNAMGYLSATLFEGLGMPIIEAMYFNLNVVVSDIPICREVTMNKAIYFDPFSFTELCNKMLKIRNHPEKVNTKEEIEVNFSKENTVEKYIQIINTI